MITTAFRLAALVLCLSSAVPGLRAHAPATEPPAQPEPVMSFEEYEPRSTLVVPEHPVTRARFPFVDVHNHQDADEMTPEQVDQLVKDMDALNMAVMVNLSGGSGEGFQKGLATLSAKHPKRFVQFANVDFRKISEPGFGETAARQLEADVKNGASGLKVFKNLGMFVKDADGKRVPTDDPRLDPIWAKCGELDIPILIHVGEPMPFWQPWDRFNERWLELKQFPNRRRDSPEFASFEQTIGELHNVIRRHPKTTFINAHLGWLGHDLGRLGRLMDEMPNMYTEIGAVLHELGRQPRFARDFLTRHQDRVLFGKDVWEPSEYHTWFRTLETADEYFPYYRKRHAFWSLYGLDLPDEVLKKLYYKNALRILPGIDKGLFPE
ncbi:MAG TPA: amidohydrolase family protein [Thermoanaerobaculia bacterium]|nr:amidohydrolase family protein [Thermoanaerobaculia bacterium]